METKEILALYDREMRQEIEFHDTRREITPYIVRHVGLQEEMNFVLYSTLTKDNANSAIQSELAYFKALGVEVEWKLYEHDQPADLKDRLAKSGFKIGEVEALMALEIENAPSFLLQPPTINVTHITNPTQIPEVLAVQQQVWEDDYSGLIERLQHDLEHEADIVSIYAVYMDGKPVSSAWTYFHQEKSFASIWGGATLPEYRKQGIYTALVAVRIQEAKQCGVRFLTIDASPMSRPIVEKLGFQFLDYTYPCTWKP